MKRYKQLLALVLATAMLLVMAACDTAPATSEEPSEASEVSDVSEPEGSEEESEVSFEDDGFNHTNLYCEGGDMRLTVNEDGSVALRWLAVEDEALSFYGVYRATSRYGAYEELAYGVDKTEYVDDTANGVDYYYKVQAIAEDQSVLDERGPVSAETALFGDNVYILSPEDDPMKVRTLIDFIYVQQERAEFGKGRYAILLKPGTYADDIKLKLGYYTTYAGLGELPTDVDVSMMECSGAWNTNALINFWRGIENVSVRNYAKFAVSQATFLRRVNIGCALNFHDNYSYASGGFFADSAVSGKVDTGSQQQWLSRNCAWDEWSGQVWNMVFVGIEEGDAPEGTWPQTKYTTVDETPVMREKPYLIWNEQDGYQVFVPALRRNSSGVSWKNGKTEGEKLPLDTFYIAKADTDTAATINAALAEGKNLLLTPGYYRLDQAIRVDRADTVVLGMGMPTLTPTAGNICMEVADVDGVTVAGVLFDTGHTNSPCLMQVGTEDGDADHSANPILLSDCFFRVGGMSNQTTSVDACLKIYANDTIGDNFWLWRADHGNGVGWDKNVAANGLIVEGDDVICYGLFAEHFREYEVLWNGNGGRVYFYQSELAYDIPNQTKWTAPDGTLGYASFKVADAVDTFEAWGLGIYSNYWNSGIKLESAMEVPVKAGVKVHNICSVSLSNKSSVLHVINDKGGSVSKAVDRKEVTEYGGADE